jgi:hypothetical protein
MKRTDVNTAIVGADVSEDKAATQSLTLREEKIISPFPRFDLAIYWFR